MAFANTPTLQLFPTSVVESLKTSAESAKHMENSLEGVISQFGSQMQLYEDSKCDNAGLDPGCAEIKKNIARSYSEMLSLMQEQIPDIKNAMTSTSKTLETNIRNKLGRNMTPMDLQRLIQGKKTGVSQFRKLSGKRQGRMSKMLNGYYKMVSLGNKQSQSTALLAAEIYADSSEALEHLNNLEMEINRSMALVEINGIWNGGPTPEMVATVNNVKSLLFGEVDDNGIPDVPEAAQNYPDGLAESDWVIE